MSKDNGGNAFPHIAEIIRQDETGTIIKPVTSGGMTLRDYFASKAMQSLASGERVLYVDGQRVDINQHTIANSAYEIADAMLAERNK